MPQLRFHADRPDDLRRSTPWHRLSHIVAELPRELARLAATLDVAPGATVLDYGCADVPYRHLFPQDARYLAADLPGNPQATVEIRADGTVPVDDASVDVVLSTQVLEHVADPAVYLRECARVLKPGGRLLLSTHGLMVYHPDPVDYWRWTSAGLRRALEQAGFRVARLDGIMGLGATGLQLFQDAYYWRLPRPLRAAFALVVQTLIRVCDRFEHAEAKRLNALVYAVVAERVPTPAGEHLIAAFAEAYPAARFVEIGANDGEQHDHLRPHILGREWRGAMVEPVPYVFERLARNYADVERVALVQAAVGPSDGRAPFHHPRDATRYERRTLPDWYDGIGSFDRDALLSHAPQIPDIAQRLVETEVEVLSFASLCERTGLDAVDLLVIDAEGYDWEILRAVDLDGHAPRLVVYEHFHLRPAERDAAREHLRAAGYEVMEEGFDTFALRPGDDALTARFRELVPVVGPVYKDMEP